MFEPSGPATKASPGLAYPLNLPSSRTRRRNFSTSSATAPFLPNFSTSSTIQSTLAPLSSSSYASPSKSPKPTHQKSNTRPHSTSPLEYVLKTSFVLGTSVGATVLGATVLGATAHIFLGGGGGNSNSGGGGGGGGGGSAGEGGDFWSRLFSPKPAIAKDDEPSQDWDFHGLPANITIRLRRLSGFKKYKVSDILFFDCRRGSTTEGTEDSFFEMVTIRPGGVYTKAQLQKELETLA